MLLLRSNSDVNKQDSDGRTPLMHAIIENHKPVVGLLLSHGAIIGLSDCDGRIALGWAVLCQRTGILQILLEHRAKYERSLDIDAPDNKGWTPLHISVTEAFEDGILVLLQKGADINAIAHKCPYIGRVMPSVDRQS
jgi:ankyrin repeat protein